MGRWGGGGGGGGGGSVKSAPLPPMRPGFDSRLMLYVPLGYGWFEHFSLDSQVFLSPEKPPFQIPFRSG